MVLKMSELYPRLMPGSRLTFGLTGSGHVAMPGAGFVLHACSGVPTARRPSRPMTHVGLVKSRCWLKIAQSTPAEM